MKHKRTILIDLDGVLNEYKGDYDKNHIPNIKEGALDFLQDLSQNYELYLFTTRDIIKAQSWLVENKIEKFFSGVINQKIPAYLIIDDRCVCFDGNYNSVLSKIKNFRIWYK